MRIAQISTLATPVRQERSGSVEGLVWIMARELTRQGHEVTVFASAGSETHGELVATLPGPYAASGSPGDWQLCEWINLCSAVEQSSRFDVMHSHAYLWGLPMQPLSQAPMVHTMHITPQEDTARLWARAPDACVTAISNYQWSGFAEAKPAAVIHHGIDPAGFTFRPEADDYLCYFGRFTWGKGPLHAIATARSLGIRLLLAGPENAYFRRNVAPLVDGRLVEYVGPVSGCDRDQLLGGARALLYPIQDPEPFGLVLVEAMMCGTPVAAIGLGAVGEIVDEGITGYCADSADDLASCVLRALELDRKQVRARAEQRFSAGRMVDQYLEVYRQVASGQLPSALAASASR